MVLVYNPSPVLRRELFNRKKIRNKPKRDESQRESRSTITIDREIDGEMRIPAARQRQLLHNEDSIGRIE